jgi:hypothetical protein
MLRVATVQTTQNERNDKREFEDRWATENSMDLDVVPWLICLGDGLLIRMGGYVTGPMLRKVQFC